jgi:hypothetical protein
MGRISEYGRIRAGTLLVGGAVALTGLSGCGDNDKFANKPRPPVPLQLTGVITDSRVTVSPNRVGAGPVTITVSNQTQRSHTITLEGESIRETIGPVNPLDTGRIQQTLAQGTYESRAGSSQAMPKEIRAARLQIGPPRKSSSGDVLLP